MGKKKTGANERCPCGSGHKFKKCHGDRNSSPANRRGPFPLGNGLSFTLPETVKAQHIETEASAIPQALLHYARQAVRDASEPHAGEREGTTALVLVVTAGEALVNRLLEPLMPVGWKEFEFEKTQMKWLKLSELLQLEPPLTTGSKPLQAYLATVKTRNDLVHFKHGRHLHEREGPPITVPWGHKGYSADLSKLMAHPLRKVRGGQIEAAVKPDRAGQYLKSLTDLLAYVIPRYPEDPFGISEVLDRMLSEDFDEAYGDEASVYLAALRRAVTSLDRAIEHAPDPKDEVSQAAADALVRVPDQLRGVVALVERELLVQADVLIRSIAEAAVTALWVGQDEERAAQSWGESLRRTRTWLQAVERHGVNVPAEKRRPFEELLKADTGRRTPDMAERIAELGTGFSASCGLAFATPARRAHFEERLITLPSGSGAGGAIGLTLHDAVCATMFCVAAVSRVLVPRDSRALVADLQSVLDRWVMPGETPQT